MIDETSRHSWLLYVFVAAYIITTIYTLAHCIATDSTRKKWPFVIAILFLPFFGTVLYWKNRPDFETSYIPVTLAPTVSPQTKHLKPHDKYCSPPPPSHIPRYSTKSPFEPPKDKPDTSEDDKPLPI
ncbi:PLD nuclease N-terminal domain-containing protein [Ereboglobus luteus]|nr:PLD nuclease N-terminal domain-containing protein [Ereboglobus luteus]